MSDPHAQPGDATPERRRPIPSDGSDLSRSRARRRRRACRPLDIAIVGMACRFPGAPDLVSYWSNLLAGRSAIGDVPPDRWDPATFCDPAANGARNDRVPSARGGYLDAPIPFDAAAFGVMPVTVAGGEPEQFLVLDAARRALADAGLPEGMPDGRRVEVVVGRGNYFNRGNLTRLQHGRITAQTVQILRALHPEWTEADLETVSAALKASLPPFGPDTVPGQLTSGTAGRIANRLNFKGASYVVDAASASALVAVDLAARSLVQRRADLAVVGAVYLQCDVDFPMVFSQLGALARSGQSRPFAADADGLVPGEGVGVLVLKRLADAERDGQRIYAVIQGVGLASDGRGPGLATPDARGHELALKRAYFRSGIHPGSVGLIEGHGLGVPASDRAELTALRRVFPPSRRRVLGAAAALIGHAMPAAGMAGLIKSALALHHRMLPASPGLETPHALLTDADAPARLLGQSRPWVHGPTQTPRRAAVSAFGFAGISAHAVLEEHRESAESPTSPGAMTEWPSEAFLLGAPDRVTWIRLAEALIDWLDAAPADVSLKDLAYTLNVGQPAFPFRVAIVAGTAEQLKARLRQALQRLADPACAAFRDSRGLYFRAEPLAREGKLAFLFPGEGSQYPGMLADLYPHFPEIQRPFEPADRLALDRGTVPPSEILFGHAGEADPALWSMGPAVGLVLSAQWGLYQLLTRLGLQPHAVAGHSSGEFLALGAAGVMAIDRQFEERIAGVGDLFERLEASGAVPHAALLALGTSREKAEAACRSLGVEPVVAMDNCPHQVVVAVDPGQAETLTARLRSDGIACEILPFGRAYHTQAFTAALGPIRQFYDGLPLNPPRVELYSCATATRMPGDPALIRSLAVAQWSAPVGFRPMIEAMYRDGYRLFVEVGARGNLTGFVEDTLRDRPALAVAANLPRRPGPTQLNHLVATLFAQGVDLKPEALYLRRRPVRLDLSEPPPARPPVLPLAVGFPSMSLPDELVQALRQRQTKTAAEAASVAHSTLEVDAAPPGPVASAAAPLVADPSRELFSTPATSSQAVPARARAGQPSMPLPDAEADAAMLAYLRTMDEFLALQRDVMSAYCGVSEPTGPATASALAPSLPTWNPTPAVPSCPPAIDPVRAGGTPALVPATGPTLAERLLAKVAERTGYPTEMLQPELDLEADLGIDSIKRVEILGDLRDGGGLPPGLDLDPLTRARTLRDVLHLLEQASGDPTVPAEAIMSPTASEPVGPWVGTIRNLVPGVSLIAERTLDLATDPVAAHHTIGGRRVSAVDPGRLALPVVPFTVMAEMLAQAAAVLVPGGPIVAMHDVRAHRWIKYEPAGVRLEVQAERDPAAPELVRVAIYNRTVDRAPNAGPVVEGRVEFGPRRPEPPLAPPFALADAGPSRFTAQSLYGEQWLFHGPAFQALTRVGLSAPRGIEGTLTVLPRGALWSPGTTGTLRTDAIVLDAFTHLLGCWGLDQLREGEVIFPLRLATLAFYGDDPAEGTDVGCRIAITDLDAHRVRADVQIVRPDGRLWMTICGWEDWRFYWPNRFRDQFRAPDRVLVGEPIDRPDRPQGVSLVWLQPPSDFSRPIWRDVMESVQLDPVERAAMHALSGPERRKTLRLWGRVAAKEAVRRLWAERGEAPVYPADLVIEPDPADRPLLRSRLEPYRSDLPAVSIGHTEGVAVALAALDPRARLGIDVERIVAREAGFEALAFADAERAELDRLVAGGGDRAEWIARFWCAKEAAGKATGRGLIVGPASVTIVAAQGTSGDVHVTLGPDLRAACPDWPGEPIVVHTARRERYAWAWTVARTAPDPIAWNSPGAAAHRLDAERRDAR